jgi:acetyltransferase-like isoleucine patch superfamily enzyme
MSITEHLDERAQSLLDDLRHLHASLRAATRKQFRRINPFYEDLFEWKERGAFWLDEERNVTIYNSTTVVGDVDIGRDTWIGPYCSLDGTGGLSIGRNCAISLGCQLNSHDTVRWALSGGRAAYEYAPVKIGDCCFLGVHAVVVRGVTIGNHCLIGAGAVVTHDVPDFTIVAGVPARRIGVVEMNDDGSIELRYDEVAGR